jgi:hypothetical protein
MDGGLLTDAVGSVQSKGSHLPAFWQFTYATCSLWQTPQAGQAASTPHVYDIASSHVVTGVALLYVLMQSTHAFVSPVLATHASSAVLWDSQSFIGAAGEEGVVGVDGAVGVGGGADEGLRLACSSR